MTADNPPIHAGIGFNGIGHVGLIHLDNLGERIASDFVVGGERLSGSVARPRSVNERHIRSVNSDE
ncbi:hypothetical protein CFOUR_01395 [Corynebacterium fournieri]|nr:hypothetical protein CFOUR_01395 [Corynebacterium fournieri]